MNYIENVSKVLELSLEDVTKYSKKVDENLMYYWNPIRGGKSLLVDNDGNYLVASSAIGFSKLLDEFKKGDKNKSFINE